MTDVEREIQRERERRDDEDGGLKSLLSFSLPLGFERGEMQINSERLHFRY